MYRIKGGDEMYRIKGGDEMYSIKSHLVRRTRFRICEMDTIMTGRRGVQEWQAVRRTALKEAMKCAGVKGDDVY